MPSPFPGMDPYLEDPVLWPGVHQRLITSAGTVLNSALPPSYVADIGERLYVVQPQRSIYADLSVLERRPAVSNLQSGGSSAAVAVAHAPWVVSVPPVEVREPFIEILSLKPSRRVVTVVEVLSPSNKSAGSEGRALYLAKQEAVLNSPVHLVELDLLRRGEHTVAVPAEALLDYGAWDYLTCVHRGTQRWTYEVWPISLRQRLPCIRLPLAEGDPDVVLDLQAALDRCYDEGGYSRLVDYGAEPPGPLPPADEEWAAALLRELR